MTESRGTVPQYYVGPGKMRQTVNIHVPVERKLRRGSRKPPRMVAMLSAEFQPMMTAILTEVTDGNW